MNKIYSTPIWQANDEDGKYAESVHVFTYDDEDEADDFQILSHNEQLASCGFKEEKTPSKGTIHRYVIDASDAYVVIRETEMSW